MSELFRLTRVDPVTGIAEPIPARERVDALLEHPDAPALIRSMDAQALYSLVHEAGVHDAYELVWMASGEQVQALVDFDCWTRDRFEMPRFADWLDLLLQRDDEGFAEMLDRMDPEPIVIWLREHVQVFLWEQDLELLDMIDAPVVTSPDGVYALVVPEEEEIGATLRLLLDRLYAHDLTTGHRFLEAVRWELTSDMAERAYQLREARLGDLGFVPFHEALEVYAWLPPREWSARARSRALNPEAEYVELSGAGHLPPVDHQLQLLEQRRFNERTTAFARALGMMPEVVPAERLPGVADSLLSQFRAVANRVHVADLGSPGDMAAARGASERAERSISLGLEFAAGEDPRVAARILATTPLKEIHRAGHSAVLELQRQARRLVERGNLSVTDAPASLLDADDRDLFEGLLETRPTQSGTYRTPFSSLDEVRAAATRISMVAFVELVVFGLWKHRRDELVALLYDANTNGTPVEVVSFRSLVATRVVRDLAGAPPELAPIELATLARAGKAVASREDGHDAWMQASLRALTAADPRDELTPLATRYAARIAGWLLDEWPNPAEPPPVEIAQQLVLLRSPEPSEG